MWIAALVLNRQHSRRVHGRWCVITSNRLIGLSQNVIWHLVKPGPEPGEVQCGSLPVFAPSVPWPRPSRCPPQRWQPLPSEVKPLLSRPRRLCKRSAGVWSAMVIGTISAAIASGPHGVTAAKLLAQYDDNGLLMGAVVVFKGSTPLRWPPIRRTFWLCSRGAGRPG
jgi:hypothetical protein